MLLAAHQARSLGHPIGKGSSIDAARAVFYRSISDFVRQRDLSCGTMLRAPLNRAIIIERSALPKEAEIVSVIPQPKAGGSFATIAWHSFTDPVAVEEIRAAAGIDIGGTMIGMHLKRVAVPVRLNITKIGEASILCARTAVRNTLAVNGRFIGKSNSARLPTDEKCH